MNYKGTIIEESLENTDVLKDLNITSTRVEKVVAEHQTPWLKQWTLHKVEIPESKAGAVAEKISKSIDAKHTGSWYADFKTTEKHYIIFRDRVFLIDRSSREQYGEMRKYALGIGVPEYQTPNYQDLPKDVLADFLKMANKSTYADKNAKMAEPTKHGSKDYHFEKNGLVYHDTYFGIRDFIGEEIVYQDENPAWGANYYGFIISEETNGQELYDFLREAMMQDSGPLIPIRGPAEYSSGKWQYKFSVTGNLSHFTGDEQIFREEKIVYRCFVHGGYIE